MIGYLLANLILVYSVANQCDYFFISFYQKITSLGIIIIHLHLDECEIPYLVKKNVLKYFDAFLSSEQNKHFTQVISCKFTCFVEQHFLTDVASRRVNTVIGCSLSNR